MNWTHDDLMNKKQKLKLSQVKLLKFCLFYVWGDMKTCVKMDIILTLKSNTHSLNEWKKSRNKAYVVFT